ncbi:MAG TPA: tripartite tricarboxylate transporter substrate-binding protein [Beijerinckiaceae bacterium]|jgi:tripartite-type tricarboxylate transporter receptor subunit TctC
MLKGRRWAAGAVAAATLAASTAGAQADATADFYKGKTITIWVGYGAGGGYDNTARVVARHYGEHIPGKPAVVVQNMPGAGSLLAANNLYNIAPKDGTVLGVFSSTVAMLPLYADPKANFDTTKFSWIGNLHRDTLSCGVWKGAGQNIRSLEDLIAAKTTVLFGSDGADAPLTRWPLFMKNVLGANLRVIAGYKGTREINLAMKQGEVHASCGMFESTVRSAYMQDYDAGDLNLFVQTGFNRNVELFGKATNLYTLMKTDEDMQMAKLVFGPAEITRPLAGPPGVPAERVAALRKALMEMMRSPALREDAMKIGVDLDPMSGEEIVAAFSELFKTPKAVVEKATVATSKP